MTERVICDVLHASYILLLLIEMAESYGVRDVKDAVPDSALTFTGSQIRQTRGRYPSLCVNDDGKIVEIHQPAFGLTWSNKFYYQVGTLLDDFTVRWSQEERELGERGNGEYSRVALNSNNNVVVVYELRRWIHYHVGHLNPIRDHIEWTGHGRISKGRYPAVALNNKGQAVIAYEGNFNYRTFYRTAQVQPQNNVKIDWSEQGRLFTDVANELSLAVNQMGCIVAASSGYRDRMYFRVGEIQANDGQNHFSIAWKATQSFDIPKCRPAVSIDDTSNVVVAYQTKSGRHLSYQVGKLENRQIRWIHQPRNYDLGCNPTIALCNNGKWLEELCTPWSQAFLPCW